MLKANVHQAKTELSKLIDAALKGEEVVIARNGVPKVKLVPVSAVAPPPRRAGEWAGKVRFIDPDWDKPDAEIERLFYDSVIFPEGGQALVAGGSPSASKPGDDSSSR